MNSVLRLMHVDERQLTIDHDVRRIDLHRIVAVHLMALIHCVHAVAMQVSVDVRAYRRYRIAFVVVVVLDSLAVHTDH